MAMEWNDLLNQLEGQTKQKLLALDRVGVRCPALPHPSCSCLVFAVCIPVASRTQYCMGYTVLALLLSFLLLSLLLPCNRCL